MRIRNDQMNIWLKVTNDKYELPVAVADSASELAQLLGIKKNNIFSAISHAQKQGYKCQYRKVVIKDGEL